MGIRLLNGVAAGTIECPWAHPRSRTGGRWVKRDPLGMANDRAAVTIQDIGQVWTVTWTSSVALATVSVTDFSLVSASAGLSSGSIGTVKSLRVSHLTRYS